MRVQENLMRVQEKPNNEGAREPNEGKRVQESLMRT